MRTKTAHRIINNAFKPFYKISIIDNTDISILNRFRRNDVRRALNTLLHRYRKIENKFGFSQEPCYNDVHSVDDIMEVMHYISDRWECSRRIKFIIRILEETK